MSKEIVFILVGARKRVGKDTVAKLIEQRIDRLGRKAVRTSFAAELKNEVQSMADTVGLEIDAFTEDPHQKEKIVRPLLIAHGMARRALAPDYWVEKVVESARIRADLIHCTETPVKQTLFVIVSDWRFPNELLKLKEQFPVIGICVSRPDEHSTIPEELENEPKCKAIADFMIFNHAGLDVLEREAAWITDWILTDHP